MRDYNRITSEVKNVEGYLQNKRVELAICIIKYIKQVFDTEITVDGSSKTVREYLTDLPIDLANILDLLDGSQVKILRKNLDANGLVSLMNENRLNAVVNELIAYNLT